MSQQPTMDIPTTTASSATPVDQSSSDISRRSCQTCRKRMSTLDKHTICISCRDIQCDKNNRCPECKEWTELEIEDYLRNRKTLDAKSKKKAENKNKSASKTSSESNAKESEIDFKDMEAKLQDSLQTNMKTMFADLTEQLLQSINVSKTSVTHTTSVNMISACQK